MGLTLVTGPALEPLTVVEAETHLRIDATSAEPTPPAPTVALISPAVAGNVDNGAHRYRVTFVTADGETDGGDISGAVTVADKTINGKVTVSNIPIGGSRVTSRKLYRTAAGGSTYLLLATIADNTTTSYTDNIADASLGAAVPSSNTTDNPEVLAFITAARQWVEEYTGRALVEQTWKLVLDDFPSDDEDIELPRPPLISVTSITYVDEDGATQTLATTEYAADTDAYPGRVHLKYDKSWPTVRDQKNAVTITYKAGYGTAAADVPAPIVAAMKLVLGDLYGLRSRSIIGTSYSENPAVKSLLSTYRVLEVA